LSDILDVNPDKSVLSSNLNLGKNNLVKINQIIQKIKIVVNFHQIQIPPKMMMK
jgi:hypothetical protein